MAAKQRASSTSSLAADLLYKISPMPYKTYVAKINECDAVLPDNFKTPGGQITLWLTHPMLLKTDVQTQTMSLTHLVHSADILELKCGLNCSKI